MGWEKLGRWGGREGEEDGVEEKVRKMRWERLGRWGGSESEDDGVGGGGERR